MTACVNPELRVFAAWTGQGMGDIQADVTASPRPTVEGGASGDIEWVSIPQLAERLGLAKESVYRLARAGQLRGAVKMGATLRGELLGCRRGQQGAHDPRGLAVVNLQDVCVHPHSRHR